MQEKPASPCLIHSLGENLQRVEEDLPCRNIRKTGEVEEENKRARRSGDEKEVAMAVMDIMTCSAPFFFTLSRRLSTHPSAPESRFAAPHSLPWVFSPIVSSHSNWAPSEQPKKKRKRKKKKNPTCILALSCCLDLSLEIYNFEGCNIVFGKSRYVGHGVWIMR